MALPFTTPSGSTYRLFYSGVVGVAGLAAVVAFDLSSLPLSVKQDETFEDNFRVFVKTTSPGLTRVANDVGFNYDASGLPKELLLTVDSDDVSNQISVEAWYIHSVVR